MSYPLNFKLAVVFLIFNNDNDNNNDYIWKTNSAMLGPFQALSGILLSNLQGENYFCFINEKPMAQRI